MGCRYLWCEPVAGSETFYKSYRVNWNPMWPARQRVEGLVADAHDNVKLAERIRVMRTQVADLSGELDADWRCTNVAD